MVELPEAEGEAGPEGLPSAEGATAAAVADDLTPDERSKLATRKP